VKRPWLFLGGVFGFLAVAAGAFAAHMLRGRVESGGMSPREFEAFQTGAEYQLVHAIALLAVHCTAAGRSAFPLNLAGASFAAGILLFSGSLYAYALSGQRWLGMVAPIGGTAFLVGWAALAFAAFRRVRPETTSELKTAPTNPEDA
jgi:uncharacterized membrane protein YgdD (TMEM256/DUF423 family)